MRFLFQSVNKKFAVKFESVTSTSLRSVKCLGPPSRLGKRRFDLKIAYQKQKQKKNTQRDMRFLCSKRLYHRIQRNSYSVIYMILRQHFLVTLSLSVRIIL